MSWEINMLEQVGDQSGKRVLVTGSNTGIGFETARMLALKGADVILACRNTEKGKTALDRIRAETPGANLDLVKLDLASLASVRECAQTVLNKYDRLDILVNNAGLMMPPFQRTEDGFELQFGTNVLGHFALTGLLFPLIEASSDARVVWLSSVAHLSGKIDFNNLNAEQKYSKWGAYGQSKLADLMLAYEMQRRLEGKGLPIISLASHPGGTNSELARNNLLLKITNVLSRPFMQSPTQGAMPSILAATAPDARGGDYYGPSGFRHMTGPAAKQASSDRSHDSDVATRLWQVCEQLTGVNFLD
jgi:NAD(P)-dependent dehydrogenase (short-subunit alcohol dehydrogenase family)